MISEKLLAKITVKWPVKVLSIAAAIIIAIFYRMNTLETRFFTVPLIIETNAYFTQVNAKTNAVRISLRGEADGIQQILEDDIQAFIDLGRYSSEGAFRVPVQIRRRGNALGIEPLEISVLPIEVIVELEQIVRRNIPVFPVFRGTVAAGYELTSQQIIPETVFAEGPRSVLENKMEFITEVIDIDRRFENFSVRVNVINNNPFITIHGDRMIEYRGTISPIVRGPAVPLSSQVFPFLDSALNMEAYQENAHEEQDNENTETLIEEAQ